jgi:hypothetical protein
MALSTAQIGITNPTGQQIDAGSVPLRTKVVTCDVTISATSDYGTNGIDLAATTLIGSSALGVTQVVDVLQATVRQSGGTLRAYAFCFDVANKTIRLYKVAGSPGIITEITASSDLAGGDIIRATLVCV